MVKTYLKYQLKDVLGQITGKQSKACVSYDGKFLYTGSNEYVLAIDLKTGQIVHKIKPDYSGNNLKSQVTCINIDKSNKQLVAGYNNGTIIVYEINDNHNAAKTFSLHKSAVTCLEFNTSENLLASGSKDTNIIVWDIIGETALYRLSGHKDGITKILFKEMQLESFDEGLAEILISSAKDNTIKLWNIKNQETIQTIADLIHKVTDFAVSENILLVGSYDQKLRLYQFQPIKKETSAKSQNNYFTMKGFINRQSNAKIISINITHDEKLISILSNDNTIEFLKVLSSKEVKYRIMKTELDKNEKNEKREKLVIKERFEEISEKTKNLLKNKDFNYKMNYYSLFKFIGENKLLSVNFVKNAVSIFNSGGKSSSKNIYKFCVCLGNNSVELYELNTSLLEQNIFYKKGFSIEEKKADEENLNVQKNSTLDTFGHRDILRHINFSERENLFLTTSNDSVKLWNYSSLNVRKGINIDSIISTTFILDDKFVKYLYNVLDCPRLKKRQTFPNQHNFF
jgi:U3 small nucleolar RNA-associated protein 12